MKKILYIILSISLFITNTALLTYAASPNFSSFGSKSKTVSKKKPPKIEMAQTMDAERSFYAGDYSSAKAILEPLRDVRDRNYALWCNQLGSVYLAEDEDAKALDSFMQAYYLMNDTAAFNNLESSAISLMGSEMNKAYKGDPYERAFNSLYVGLLLQGQNDLDNALAAFKNGILADSDVEGGLYKSDMTLLYLLAARLELIRNNGSKSNEYFNKAMEAYRLSYPDNRGIVSDEQAKILLLAEKQEELEKLETERAKRRKNSQNRSKKMIALDDQIARIEKSLADLENLRQENNKKIDTSHLGGFIDLTNNTLLCIELGRGPIKFPIGKYGEKAVFTQKPCKANNLSLVIDGKNVMLEDKFLGNNDIFYQARTRGGRVMDGILKGQAQFKQTSAEMSYHFSRAANDLSNQINQMQMSEPYADTTGLAATSTALAVIGLACAIGSAVANPAADVRHWSLLPGQIKVIPLKLQPGKHHIQIGVSDENGVRLTHLDCGADVDIHEGENVIIKRICE